LRGLWKSRYRVRGTLRAAESAISDRTTTLIAAWARMYRIFMPSSLP
jgi:hypothetical protein